MEASYKCFSSWFPKRQYILLAGGSTGTDTWKRCLRPLKESAARGCPAAVRPLLLVIPLCLSFPKGIRFSDHFPRIAYHSSSLPARLQQLPRVLQTRLRQLCAAQHPRHLACPLVLIHPPDRRSRPSTLLLLFNRKMLVRKRRNLRQMRNAHHLLPLRQRLQLAPHRLRRPAPNPNVDLVEHQHSRRRQLRLFLAVPGPRRKALL